MGIGKEREEKAKWNEMEGREYEKAAKEKTQKLERSVVKKKETS